MLYEIVLFIIAIVLALGGIAGAILPILPGSFLSLMAMLVFYFSDQVDLNLYHIITAVLFAIFITVSDFWLPGWGTKKFGGSKSGIAGSTIGLIAGMFLLPPVGFIIGPFLGAFIGEKYSGKPNDLALKAAWGSFLGFLFGTGLKLGYALAILGYVVWIWSTSIQ